MKTKGIFERAKKWWEAVGHWGHLGRTASNRSFLIREQKKILIRLGDKALPWLKEQKHVPSELTRLVEQYEKISQFLANLDYGGKEGVDFHSKKKKNS